MQPFNSVNRGQGQRRQGGGMGGMPGMNQGMMRQLSSPQNAGRAYNMYNQFAGSGSGSGGWMSNLGNMFGGGGGSGSGGGWMSSLGNMFGGGGGGSAAGGGGSSIGSAVSSAGPWAALAAVIAGNELYARDQGKRPESESAHLRDALFGRAMYTDVNERWAPQIWGDGGETSHGFGEDLKSIAALGTPQNWEDAPDHVGESLSKKWDKIDHFFAKVF